jgi:hypothetical protein
MISVLFGCHSRADNLKEVLPLWLAQEGVDFELVIGTGPLINLPKHPRIKCVPLGPIWKMGAAYNEMVSRASGDILLITQGDMLVKSSTQLKRMLAKMTDDNMVSERHMTQDYRDKNLIVRAPGIYLQFLMVKKQDIIDAGGWFEGYDCPCTAAHEDADLVARLLKNNVNLDLMMTPEAEGVWHIWHPRPDYLNDPLQRALIANGYDLYKSRQGENVVALYTRQFARNMTRTRREQHGS